VKPRVPPAAKPKTRKARQSKAGAQKKASVLPRVTVAPPLAAVSVRHTFQRRPSDSFDLRSLLILLGLTFAIACFMVALVPAAHVKWRPAAIFVSDRQLDLTVVGLALLVAAACTLLWTSGP
jgi:hypothetical protein